MNTKLFILAIILFSLLIISCNPSKTFVRTNDVYQDRILKSGQMGIITDVCLDLDPLFKKDYVILDDSKVAGSFMAEEAKKYLENKGYTVNYTFSPFVGSFLSPVDSFRIAITKGEKVRKETAPFYADEKFSSDTAYADALYEVLNAFYYTMTNNIEPPFSSDSVLVNSLKTISDYTGDDLILFMIGNGTVVPLGKTLFQGLTIGLLTALVTFGYYTYYFYDVSSFDSYLGLIDLKSGEMLWSNFMQLTGDYPNTEQFYSGYWAENLLYYYPDKKAIGIK